MIRTIRVALLRVSPFLPLGGKTLPLKHTRQMAFIQPRKWPNHTSDGIPPDHACALHSVENLQGFFHTWAVEEEGASFKPFGGVLLRGKTRLGRLWMSSLIGGCQ